MIEGIAGVHRDGILHLAEEILVIHDQAIGLVVAIEAIGAADRLEQAVILHRLVDVEHAAGGGIEAGEELVNHNQQLHLGGLLDETLFG